MKSTAARVFRWHSCTQQENMAVTTLFRSLRRREVFEFTTLKNVVYQIQPSRQKTKFVELPPPDLPGTNFRRIVHFKDEYTIEPLKVTNLAGRDPKTGRCVVKGLGGGIKHKYHWIKWVRDGPEDLDQPPRLDKVLDVLPDGCRTAHIALIGSGSELYYILATENMKPGDIIKTHRGVTENYIHANEGDSYPVACLPPGTLINCVEKHPGLGGFLIHAAGTCGKIIRKDLIEQRVLVQLPSKHTFSLRPNCMATVGRLSNAIHSSIPIGSAQRLRELGYRPRSGLWQRKTGRFGRKLKTTKEFREKKLALEKGYCVDISVSEYS